MLALDISGSMLARECATCPTRYDILRQAVAIFAQLWSQAGRPNDRLGVTYFRTMVDEPLIAGERLPVLTGNTTTVIADVNGQNVVAANLTAMGGGLQRSIEALRALAGRPGRGAACHSVFGRDAERQPDGAAAAARRDRQRDRPAGLRRDAGHSAPAPRCIVPLKVDTIAVGTGAFAQRALRHRRITDKGSLSRHSTPTISGNSLSSS